MKQVVQDLTGGETRIVEVPIPAIRQGTVLIQSGNSLISAGTERMLVDFGRAGLLGKARQQPERVREVIQKARSDGILETLDAVRSKLGEPLPLGYCNAGRVCVVGEGVTGFAEGDRVVSNGPHADFVRVPSNLCARVPDGVSDEAAAFTVLGAVALQGTRLAAPSIGECFVVTGLGLLGLLTVQILRAQGCRVLGLDFEKEKLELASRFGAEIVDLASGEDVEAAVERFSRGRGVDGVLITAATSSNEPVRQAARMCRKRGRIILVGVSGLELDRTEFFQKELTFQVSCSYGPGRYDSDYEDKGQDYPVAFVRWTAQRNFEAFLDLLAQGSVQVDPLISHRFALDQASEAYDLLANPDQQYLGILLEYPNRIGITKKEMAQSKTIQASMVEPASHASEERGVGVAFVGAGNYAGRVLIPAFQRTGVAFRVIANSGGISASHRARRFGFERLTTDAELAITASDVDAVVIATRHGSHAKYVVSALQADKHVFCEKPLALTEEDLEAITEARQAALSRGKELVVTVGFNRRFAPLMLDLKRELLKSSEPVSIVYTCNAGSIPRSSWVHDPTDGGGRIIGEACHFFDAVRFLVGTPILRSSIEFMNDLEGLRDTATISMAFQNGSIAAVHYFANGSKSLAKERIEVFQGGRTFRLDNFRSLIGFGINLRRKSWRIDKGQSACAEAFIRAVQVGGGDPIPFDQVVEVSQISIDLASAGRSSVLGDMF